MNIPSEQALWQMGKSADEWLAEHDAKIRADAIDDFYQILTRNFMKMIAEHTIGEILDKSYEQIKEQPCTT